MKRDEFLGPPEHSQRPEHSPPRGATDCHAHIFGPFDRFPLVAERSYSPPELPGERYLRMLDEIGFERGVLVQPTPHGTDCSAMLHALSLDRSRLRGIAVVPSSIAFHELEEMNQQGVRGARFCQPPGAAYRGGIDFSALEKLAPHLARLGWHAQVWASCDALLAAMPRLLTQGVPLVVDHMGHFEIDRGMNDPSFQGLLRLVGEGRIWLKLGSFRLSDRYPNYEDLVPFHRAIVAANSERLIWGSDWPHVHMTAQMPDVGHLIDLLNVWTDDAVITRRILVDNPVTLYGF